MACFAVSVWRPVISKAYCFLTLFVWVLAFPCGSFASEPEAMHIFSLINERLGYMEQVALYKHQTHIPVEDLAREKFILDKSLLSASEQGLDPDSISEFFQSQMDAAKAIQYRYRADWLASPPKMTEVVDLKNDIRPKLVALGKEIITCISKYLKQEQNFSLGQQITFIDTVKVHNLSTADKEKLFRSLLGVKSYSNLLND